MQSTNFNKRLNQAITASQLHDAMDRTLAEMARGRKPRIYVENIFREAMLLEADQPPNASAPPAQPAQQNQTQQSTSGVQISFDQYVDDVKNMYKRKLRDLCTKDIDIYKNNNKLNPAQKNNYIKVIAACFQRLTGSLNQWQPRQYDKDKDKGAPPYDPNQAGLGGIYTPIAKRATSPTTRR